jgi:hypothetical protein
MEWLQTDIGNNNLYEWLTALAVPNILSDLLASLSIVLWTALL